MSLLNQVLQDLEKRHASESELKSLPPFVRAVPARPRSLARPIVGIVAILIIAGLAAAAWYFVGGMRRTAESEGSQSVSKPNSMAAPAPTPAVTPAPAPAPKPAEAPAPPPAATATAAPTYTPVSRLSDELSEVQPLPTRRERERLPTAPKPERKSATPAPEHRRELPPEPKKPAVEQAKPEAPAKPAAAEVVAAPAPAPLAANDASGAIDKQMRETTAGERAEIAFRRGVAQIREGRANAAELEFRDALKQDPTHAAARQALLGLLLDSGRNAEAEQLLHKALEINPRQPRHAMVLARLEVERGEVTGAINTLVSVLPYVQSDAEFYAFLAALLQREGRHREAADYYRAALRLVPGNGVWMMGLGISLRGSSQMADARDAFQRALESKQLSPDLQDFVERQLRELSPQPKK